MITPTSAPAADLPRVRYRSRRRPVAALLLIGLVLGALAGLAFGLATTGTRHAGAYLVVAPLASAANPGDAGGATTYAKAYAEVAGQPDVLDGALAPFARDGETVDDIADGVTVSASQDAPLLQVSAQADTTERAVDLTAAAADAVVDYLRTSAATSGYQVSVLTPAAAARSAGGLTPPLTAVLGGVLGLAAAGAVSVLRR